jgi:hypothetical protein
MIDLALPLVISDDQIETKDLQSYKDQKYPIPRKKFE